MKISRVAKQNVLYLNTGIKEFCVSYEIPVAIYNFLNDSMYVTDKKFSKTTTKHINKWKQRYNNFETISVLQEEIQNEFDSIC